MGTGSTGIAAYKLGCYFLGIDNDLEASQGAHKWLQEICDPDSDVYEEMGLDLMEKVTTENEDEEVRCSGHSNKTHAHNADGHNVCILGSLSALP